MMQNIGCDILEYSHFEDILNKFPSFIDKVYSVNEIKEYHKRNDDITYLASRFCAKEAIYKALKKYDDSFSTIEILNDANNAPIVNFLNGENYNIMVSISYEKHFVMACAFFSSK